MRRRVVALAIALVGPMLGSIPALADTGGSIITDHGGAEAIATGGRSRPGATGGGSSTACQYRLMGMAEDEVVFDSNGNPIQTDGTGQWYEKWCGTVFFGAVYISAVDPADLLQEARRRLSLPLPTPQLNPAGEQLVHLPTWMWIDPAEWVTRRATASVPGVAVTVTATPESALWDMGDGTVVECSAGTPFDLSLDVAEQATTCSHRYEQSSAGEPGLAFAATVTVRWRLAWTVTGAPGGGPLGTLARTTPFSVPVAEVQAVNVNTGAAR